MPKLLTLIVPTYNMEALLARCLGSLVLADAPALMTQVEVLVIIDGATDGSSAIAHSFQEDYPQTFRVIDKENGNYGSCINLGLQEAQGKYVKVLDADDSLNPAAFRAYLEMLATLDVDLVITSGSYVTTDGTPHGEWKFDYDSEGHWPIEELRPLWIHYVTYRTEILRQIGYRQTEGISYTDEEWCFYPVVAVREFYTLPVALYRYTVGREGQTMNPDQWIKAIGNEIRVTCGMLDYLEVGQWRTSRAAVYICQKVSTRIASFYRRAMIDFALYNNAELASFDQFLAQKNPEIFAELADVQADSKRFPFRFVRYWRRNHRHLNPRMNRFRLYRFWLKMRALKH